MRTPRQKGKGILLYQELSRIKNKSLKETIQEAIKEYLGRHEEELDNILNSKLLLVEPLKEEDWGKQSYISGNIMTSRST